MLAFLGGAWGFLGSPLGGRISAALALALGLLCVAQCTAKQTAQAEARSLSNAIHAPVTGWAARLATCKANTAALEGAVRDQSAKVQAFRDEMAGRVAASDKALSEALKGKARAERNAAGLQALARAAGPDACADLGAVDAAVLGALK